MSLADINMQIAIAARDRCITAEEGSQIAAAGGEYLERSEKKALRQLAAGLRSNSAYVEYRDTYGDICKVELESVDPKAIEVIESSKQGRGFFSKIRNAVVRSVKGFTWGAGVGFVGGGVLTAAATIAGVFPPSAPVIITIIGVSAGGTAVYRAITENGKD